MAINRKLLIGTQFRLPRRVSRNFRDVSRCGVHQIKKKPCAKTWGFLTGLTLLVSAVFCSVSLLGQKTDYSSHIKIFFSPPADLNHKLATHIDDAKESIKACFYAVNSEEVAYALIKAHLRGVKVQVIMDKGRLFEKDSFYPKLKNFGLVRRDTITKGLMHDKFCIIDGAIVWTGSYNPNPYAIYENNDAVVIESEKLANIYTQEFEKLWGAEITRQGKAANRRIRINENTIVEIYFSPEDGELILQRILELLGNAKSSIYFAQFTITHPDIAKILIKKAREGTDVKGIMEYDQIGSYSKYFWFELMNMGVKKDKNYSFVFHNKFFIIDEKIVITGSLNPTIAGFGKNRENVLMIYSPQIAKKYSEYFRSVP